MKLRDGITEDTYNMDIQSIQKTSPNKILGILRIIGAIPLLSIGIQHASGLAPMLPILVGSKIPLPELNAVVAPIFEIIAASLLLVGFFGRIGNGCSSIGFLRGRS